VTHLVRGVLALAIVTHVGRSGRRWTVPLVAALWTPMLGAGLAAAVGALVVRHRFRARRLAASAAARELPVLAELLGIGLTAGMAPAEALGFAADRLTSELALEVETVRRGMARSGSAAVLSAAGGRAGRLYLLIGRAMATGAPVLAAVERFAEEQRAEDRAEREAALRRLPVLLAFPLALLILPGFVLLTVAPALSGALARLGL
jgi:hypothetical protein